ncbi:MAG: hypothetical protein JWO83_3084 [Caulobacteraceae bacterium]|jgi:hypothetical protein|nr:hypothetical protein [Caulobacteraceae bacterium]
MKLSALMISAAALAAVCGGSALAQTTAPATMQPIPNPPETAATAHGHMGKHHAKHHRMHAKADKAADTKADSTATAPPTK